MTDQRRIVMNYGYDAHGWQTARTEAARVLQRNPGHCPVFV